MAHKPADKAKGVLMLIGGATLNAVSKALNVPKSTVQGWSDEVKEASGNSPADTRLVQCNQILQELVIETMSANIAIARRVGDPDFLKGKTVDDVIKLSTHINGWLIKFDAVAASYVPALPSPAEALERVVGEPVEETD